MYTVYGLCHARVIYSKWLLLSWLLHKWKREFFDTNLRSGNLTDVTTECFSLHQSALMKTKAFGQNIGKVSDLKS